MRGMFELDTDRHDEKHTVLMYVLCERTPVLREMSCGAEDEG